MPSRARLSASAPEVSELPAAAPKKKAGLMGGLMRKMSSNLLGGGRGCRAGATGAPNTGDDDEKNGDGFCSRQRGRGGRTGVCCSEMLNM